MKNPFSHKLTMKQIVFLLLGASLILYVLHYLPPRAGGYAVGGHSGFLVPGSSDRKDP